MLDEAVDLVSRGVPGWAGFLVLTSLPLRFLEAHFWNRLAQLGTGARGVPGHVTAISWLVTLALLPSLWGRAVFVRACLVKLSGGGVSGAGGTAGRTPLRQRLLPPGFAAYCYTALVFEALFFALGWSLVAIPVLALFTGLAAATSALDEPPGLLASPLRVLRHVRPPRTLIGLIFVHTVALLVTFLCLTFLFWLTLALADGTAGLDLSWWKGALSWENRPFVLLLLTGSVAFVEPFWLASLTVTVRRLRARQTGEDLAAWLADLRAREEAA